MKAVAVGPISRLAAFHSTDRGFTYSRNDWSVGRDLSAEETRAGILLSVSELLKPGTKKIQAVVKAQPSDLQVGEIGAADGCVAALQKDRRARWRKISRPSYYLAENTATPFSDPDKSFSPLVQSHGEYVRRLGKLPEHKPLLRFVLFRDRHTVKEVMNRFHYEIGATADAFSLALPPGGSYACVTQYGTAIGVTKEQLVHASRRYNLHPLILDPQKYHTAEEFATLTQPPLGYQYRLLLRFVAADEDYILRQLRQWSENGFINYYGMDRFGANTSALFDIGAYADRADFPRAVGSFLQSVAENDPFHYPHFLAYINSKSSTTTGLLEKWISAVGERRSEKQLYEVLLSLKKYHDSSSALTAAQTDLGATATTTTMADVWSAVPLSRQARTSAAEFVWNAMVSQRLFTHGVRVVEGDLVRIAGAEGDVVRRVTTTAEAEQVSMFDVVMPVPYDASYDATTQYPGPGNAASRDAYERFAKKHALSFLFDRTSTTPSSLSPAVYRPICSRPHSLSSCIVKDPSSLATLKDDLFLLRENKESSHPHDLSLRLREPSIFNMSERLQAKLHVVSRERKGTQSVALAFTLPASTCPWVALRDIFSLQYLRFTDFVDFSV